jgi:DNA-binding XRE family transcriptional regulator
VEGHETVSLLEKLGLSKQSMEKMLGVVAVAKKNKIKRYRRYETVPKDIREAILKENPSYTCRELAKKYGISSSTIWDIRESKSKTE